MTTISTVFPEDYQNPPTDEQVREEVKECIGSAENIPADLVYWLHHTECPYLREARARVLIEVWEELSTARDERTCCMVNDCWYLYWSDYQDTLRCIIRLAEKEQQQLKEEKSATEKISPKEEAKPKKTIKVADALQLISEKKKQSACKVEYHFHGPVNFTDVHDNQSVTLQPA